MYILYNKDVPELLTQVDLLTKRLCQLQQNRTVLQDLFSLVSFVCLPTYKQYTKQKNTHSTVQLED